MLRTLAALLAGSWLAGLLSACGVATPAQGETQNYPTQISARAIRVVDGDSLYLEGYRPQIRLWGVDAPERDEAGFAAARDALAALALQREIRCERVDIDKYRRLVARCVVDAGRFAGTDINRALIERGVANEYCWFSKGYYGHCN
ncbi:MAG: thermonuclease family protein, partial [Pseudomonadales bacterium]